MGEDTSKSEVNCNCSLICVFQEGLEWALKNISSLSKK